MKTLFLFQLGNLDNRNQQTADGLVAPPGLFVIGRVNGSVTTNGLLSRYLYHKFTATVSATDSDGLTANADLWVSPSFISSHVVFY